jgi:preprotein translocase subunit YajC
VETLASLLPLLLIALVFWFLILRPSRKRAADLAATQRSLQPGTRVMLSSGIFGTVASLDDEAVSLDIAPGTTVRVHRQAVAKVVEPTRPSTGEAHDELLPPGSTSL